MYDELYHSLFDIVAFFNRPHQDGHLLNRAGVSLDQTYFPLLMVVQHRQPIGLVELASSVGKDYSTVSRQVDSLVEMGLVETSQASHDRRVRHIKTTTKGQAMIDKIAEARRLMMAEHLSDWSDDEIEQLRTALAKLADSLTTRVPR